MSPAKRRPCLRFNCFDQEKSYVYGPENPDPPTAGAMTADDLPETLNDAAKLYRMDPIADGNPIGWTIRTVEKKLPKMLQRAGYPQIAAATDLAEVQHVLPDVEACARELFAAKRNTVKHNRGTQMFEAGNIRFGLEMRLFGMLVRGWRPRRPCPHGCRRVDGKSYVEETEILAFDCFWQFPHYHYGPRNKNHRIFWDKTLVDDPLGWVFDQFEDRKLGLMIERAGYPGVAADLDLEKIASLLPVLKKKARELQAEGERLTGHPGLPLEPTPNLAGGG